MQAVRGRDRWHLSLDPDPGGPSGTLTVCGAVIDADDPAIADWTDVDEHCTKCAGTPFAPPE